MNFTALQHSTFLQALGSAILGSLWQGFALWLIYQIISVSYKGASAKFKTNLSTLILFFSFAWFLLNFIYKITAADVSSAITPSAVTADHTTTAVAFWNYEALLSFGNSALPYLSVAYIFLLFFLMARLVAAYRYVYFISSKNLSQPPPDLKVFASVVAGQIGITKKISVWISHHIDVPATIGFIKPIILIPFASINNLSGSQLEAIILHELSHIKRNDYAINLAISVIETILFFNPFIVLLSNAIKRERENCCDDFVLQYQYDPHAYASALLSLERSRVTNLKLAMGAVSGKKQLLSRIKRITNREVISRQFNYGQKLLALLLITSIICSLAWLAPVEKKTVSGIKLKKENVSQKANASSIKIKPNNLPKDLVENMVVEVLKHVEPKYKVPRITHQHDTELTDMVLQEKREDLNQIKKLRDKGFFVNGDSLQFPSSFDIKNFPFQKMDVNVNCPNIDFAKLDDHMKEAWVTIKDIDWNKFRVAINGPLSKLSGSGFPKKEQLEMYVKKAENASRIFNLQLKANAQAMLAHMQRDIIIRDSLTGEQEFLSGKNDSRTKNLVRLIKKRKGAADMDNNLSMNYSAMAPPYVSEDKIEQSGSNGNLTFPRTTKMDRRTIIRISMKRLSSMHALPHDKKIFSYDFINDSKTPGTSNEVHIEVTDIPQK